MTGSCFPEPVTAGDLLALAALPGVGEAGIATRLAVHGSAAAALAAEPAGRAAAARAAAEAQLARGAEIGARPLLQDDADYPAALRDLPDPPRVLWAAGRLAAACAPAVAIVGTRDASPYGARVARRLATACAHAGVAVVSGLARGIDAAAHLAALEAGGRTVGVVGTGLDIAYPRSHRALQARIAREGLLLGELPPGAGGHGGTFPRRNRLIAALAEVTVVVEAGARSGALITAGQALDLGRTVAAVPGPIDAPLATGGNRLLRSGAQVITDPDDLLALLHRSPAAPSLPALDADAAACWAALGAGAGTAEAIAANAGLSLRAAIAALAALELEGLVCRDAAGRVQRAA